MRYAIELPDELAHELAASLPQSERKLFALNAIASALENRNQDADARLSEALLADMDPTAEPDREASDCAGIIEEGLAEVDAGRNLHSFEEIRRRWAEEKALREQSVAG